MMSVVREKLEARRAIMATFLDKKPGSLTAPEREALGPKPDRIPLATAVEDLAKRLSTANYAIIALTIAIQNGAGNTIPGEAQNGNTGLPIAENVDIAFACLTSLEVQISSLRKILIG